MKIPSLIVLVAAILVVARPAQSLDSPPVPFTISGCAFTYTEDIQSDNPTIVIRNECGETLHWRLCVRDGDMAEAKYFEDTLEHDGEVGVDVVIDPVRMGEKFSSYGFAVPEGEEMPWPEC